ncbi:MAG: class I SAM-dependent methyltransferase [Proteobacteria bacterium]|nr:class I SAM-dependent methyltransferase [Pseudomonadota bacterium]
MVSQFAKPTGLVGRFVGWIFANRGSNVRRSAWTVGLLKLLLRDRVLEIGCGPGIALKACLKRASEGTVVGLDHSGVMIAQARKRNLRAVRKKRLRLVTGTLADLPDSEPPFDKIFSVNVIQFIADKKAFVADCVKRLAPGGMFATTFQPRGGKPTREQAIEMGKTLEALLTEAGLSQVRTQLLELKPVPAICVLGQKT